ncbi:putative Late nodulin [Medicago truncatula]|uniref:Nodule Cysteine-Rich (NCR) secreted peptide n=1 Tax=Medicago truncatula TaxID=3880 RepID=A7KH69_MEDTR|nr:nodule-specific cysteine-rich peptide 26 [Medicago truncatula]AES98048.1 Nodule Cysteine-Rich (NCR) secreted peptide [Medicago truncatula]RHN56116.1 putative Late nodulin [Medicago truncatula]
MAKTLNFVCAMILFISLFLVSKNVALYIIECKTDADCPISKLNMYNWRCIKSSCHLYKVIQFMV